MELNEYQQRAKNTDQRKPATTKIHENSELQVLIPLLGLVGEIGSVAAEHKKRLRDGQSYTNFVEKFKKELGDVLWYVAILADDMNITLEDIAKENLSFIDERWNNQTNFLPDKLFDETFPKDEQFPRELVVEFKEVNRGAIAIFADGNQLGDYLDDNAYSDDGYRFHDIFHLTFMGMLGWSPVMRKILCRKRKSIPDVDRVEDGARAIIIEEAISAMIYEHAKDHNFFQNVSVIDIDLLNTIKGMVRNFEVRNVSRSLWEKAIISGYQVYRSIKATNGGKVRVSLLERKVELV